jgi:hypothetical protein
VLTGEKRAPEAAAALENELVGTTGFKKGPPLGKLALNRTLGRSNNLSPTGFSVVPKR